MRTLGSILIFALLAQGGRAQSASEWAERAATAQRQGDFQAAAVAYRSILDSGHDSPQLRSNLGLMYYLQGDAKDAMFQFQKALRQDRNLLAANLFLGFTYLRLGNAHDALAYVQRAVSQQSNALAPQLALGRVEIALRNVPTALSAYRKATVIDPQSAEAWYGRGIAARELADATLRNAHHNGESTAKSELDEAQQALARAQSLDPDGLQAHMILGEAFRVSGRLDDSVAEYRAVLQSHSKFAPAYLGLANTYWKFGRIDETMSATKEALAIRPNDGEANGIMAQLLVARNQMTEAFPFAQRALQARPDLSSVRIALAKIYLSQSKLKEALPELETAVADDRDGTYHYILAETLRKLGRTQEAATALQQSRKLMQASHT